MAVNHSQQSRLIFVVKLLVATLNIGEGNERISARTVDNKRSERECGGREGGRWEFTFPPNCNLAQNIVPYEIF